MHSVRHNLWEGVSVPGKEKNLLDDFIVIHETGRCSCHHFLPDGIRTLPDVCYSCLLLGLFKFAATSLLAHSSPGKLKKPSPKPWRSMCFNPIRSKSLRQVPLSQAVCLYPVVLR